MRTLDPTTQIMTAASEQTTFHLLKLTIDGTDFCITDCDIPLVYGGDVYEPRRFKPGNISYSLGKVVDSMRLRIDNNDDYFSYAFLEGTPQGSAVTLRRIFFPFIEAVGSMGGPDGWWRFEEGTGLTAYDATSNGNDGTLEGTSPDSGWVSGGLSFAGVDQRVDCGTSSPLDDLGDGDFSVVIDMKSADATPLNNGVICGKYYDANNRFLLRSDGTNSVLEFTIDVSGTGEAVTTFSDLNPFDTYRHRIVLVISGDDVYCYLDSTVSSTVGDISSLAADRSNAGNLSFGAINDGNSPFEGTIYDAQVYPWALTADEVTALSNHPGTSFEPGVATPFSGELDAWRFDGSSLEVNVVNQYRQWNRRTLNKHLSSCRWKVFGGTQCGYSGSETECDRSYARCLELGNANNFGGFRWLPGIEDKVIWWGRASK